jgi:hypothetical protein
MGFLSGITKAVAGITGKMNLPAGVAGVMSQALGKPMDQRQAFTAVLLATVAHVNEKPNFNLELEINDLWIHMSVLRNAEQTSSGVGGLLKDMAGTVSGMLNNALKMQFNEGVMKSLTAVIGAKK